MINRKDPPGTAASSLEYELMSFVSEEIRQPPERERYDEEPTASRPLSLTLVDFQCPVCHTPIAAEDTRGSLRLPQHRIGVPVYPFGLSGPMHRVECPASLMEITQLCDGEHRGPCCDDPQCYHRDNPDSIWDRDDVKPDPATNHP